MSYYKDKRGEAADKVHNCLSFGIYQSTTVSARTLALKYIKKVHINIMQT